MLPPEWTGKSLVPFIIRPTTECTLTRLPEMRFVVQEVNALGHDVSSANPPVCRFSFRLPTVVTPDLQQRLDALVSSDTLVKRTLELDLQVEASIAWTQVRAAVADALSASSLDPEITSDQARSVVERALDSPALAVVRAAVTASEHQAFVDAALNNLFVQAADNATLVTLATTAPPGSLLYHVESLSRLM